MQAGQFVDEPPGPASGTPPGSLDSQQGQLPGSYKGKGSALPPLQRADSVKHRTIQVCAWSLAALWTAQEAGAGRPVGRGRRQQGTA